MSDSSQNPRAIAPLINSQAIAPLINSQAIAPLINPCASAPLINPCAIAPLIDDWVRFLQAEKRASIHTIKAYQSDLAQFLEFLTVHFGVGLKISDFPKLEPADFRSFLAHVRKNNCEKTSMARKLSSLRSFFGFVEKRFAIKTPAITAIRPPRRAIGLPRPLSVHDACQLPIRAEKTAKQPWVGARDKAILLLLYGSGLRISEALGLTGKACDKHADRLIVKGKGGRERILPLLAPVRAAICAYKHLCPFPLQDDQPLFRGQRGKVLNARIIQRLVEKLRIQLGLASSATPHALRHSFASHLLEESSDIRAIQSLLGHQSLSSTQLYTKIQQSELINIYRASHPRCHFPTGEKSTK